MDTLTRPAVRGPMATLWLLRLVLTVHLVAVLAQPVLAGLFLTGDVDAISVHAAIGSSLAALGLVTIGAAAAYVVVGRGCRLALPGAVVLFFVEGFQIGMGYARQLQLHVPLGVAIVTIAVLLAIWVWTPAAARPRRVRRGAS